MDLKKAGTFISSSRKAKGLTQIELAEKIGVTDKAISRWETGKGFPDVSNLIPLSEALNVSITEIVNGESTPPENKEEKADSALLEALSYAKGMIRKTIGIVLLIIGVVLMVFLPLVTSFSVLTFAGAAVFVLGIILLRSKNALLKSGMFRLTKRLTGALSLTSLAVAVILEILPCGVVLIFYAGPNTPIKRTYSYFSLTPFGYAHFSPLITAVLTVCVTALSVIAFIGNYKFKRIQNSAFVCTFTAIITSILAWTMAGAESITGIGAAVSIFLVISLLFQAFSNRNIRLPEKIGNLKTK